MFVCKLIQTSFWRVPRGSLVPYSKTPSVYTQHSTYEQKLPTCGAAQWLSRFTDCSVAGAFVFTRAEANAFARKRAIWANNRAFVLLSEVRWQHCAIVQPYSVHSRRRWLCSFHLRFFAEALIEERYGTENCLINGGDEKKKRTIIRCAPVPFASPSHNDRAGPTSGPAFAAGECGLRRDAFRRRRGMR